MRTYIPTEIDTSAITSHPSRSFPTFGAIGGDFSNPDISAPFGILRHHWDNGRLAR